MSLREKIAEVFATTWEWDEDEEARTVECESCGETIWLDTETSPQCLDCWKLDRILALLHEGQEPVAVGALDERGRILASQALIDEKGVLVFREMWKDYAEVVPLYTHPPRADEREHDTAAYTKSLRDQIDSLKATRAHDKLKIDGLESRLARYREALTQALTWEGRLNKAEQLGMQKRHPEAFAIKAAVAEEMKTARALASTDTEGGA